MIEACFEYCAMSSLFSPAIYQILIRIAFQTRAPEAVNIIKRIKLILNIPAGILISCLTAGTNLPRKVVIHP